MPIGANNYVLRRVLAGIVGSGDLVDCRTREGMHLLIERSETQIQLLVARVVGIDIEAADDKAVAAPFVAETRGFRADARVGSRYAEGACRWRAGTPAR